MRGVLGMLLWIGAAAAAGWLWYHDQPTTRPLPGLVGPPHTPLAPAETARLISVEARLGATLKAGAVVARFDTADLDAELAVARAEKAAADAEIAAEGARRAEARLTRRTQLLTIQAEAKAAQGEAKARRAAATAEMRTLGRSVERIRKIAAEGLARGDGLASIEGRRARLRQEARTTNALVTPWVELQRMVDAKLTTPAADADPVIAAAQARADVWADRIKVLEARRARRTVVMPFEGRVVHVRQQPGATVPAGAPIVEIAPASTRLVRVWAPEQGLRRWKSGEPVTVRSVDGSQPPVNGMTGTLGPGVVALPQRLWQHPNVPLYGRLIEITLDTPGFMSGESVAVRAR